MSVQSEPATVPSTGQNRPVPNPVRSKRRVSPQLLAWLVMLVSFGLFCVLVYVIASTITGYLSHSVQHKLAHVTVVRDNNVFIQRLGQPKETLVAESETVQEGDEIRTDKNSEAVIKFFDDSRVDLSAGSRVRIQESRVDIKNFRQTEKRLVIKVLSGVARFTVAPFVPAKDFNKSTFTAVIPGENDSVNQAFAVFNDAETRTYIDGVFTLSVSRSQENGVKSWLSNKSSRPVEVRSGTDARTVAVGPGQRVAVEQGVLGVPGLPADNQVELIENGSYINGIDSWRVQPAQLPGANYIQGLLHFDAERINDGIQPRARIFRLDPRAKGTPYETSIVQEINRDVSDYEELWFSLKVKLVDQSLAGGGSQGAEYPMFVKINFVDQNNNLQELFHGFYSKANDTSTQDQNQLGRSSKLPQDEWQEWRINLMNGSNKPLRILKIVVGSAGHLYDSYFTDVSLIAR
jgi:hypothetical protein